LWRKTVWKKVTLELINISKIIWFICITRFSKYFPEAKSDKYKWISDLSMLIRPKITTFLSREEEESYTDIIAYTSLKVHFLGKSYIEFGVGIGGGSCLTSGKL
jgi:hypothetical protein